MARADRYIWNVGDLEVVEPKKKTKSKKKKIKKDKGT